MVVGWFHGKGLFGGLQEIKALGGYELAARVVTLMVAFLPLFAFWALGLFLKTFSLIFLHQLDIHT